MPRVATSVDDQPSSPPGGPRAVVSRFACAYWAMFCAFVVLVDTQVNGTAWIGKLTRPVWAAMIAWVGRHILGIQSEIAMIDNSGDTVGEWVSVFCFASLALIVAAVWSVVDRRRARDVRLREALRVLVRYTLAFVMLSYGVLKLFFGQFPEPSAGQLMQRVADATPHELLWTFMGISPAYVFFSGAGETLGALLLLFRRTTTLGALVLAAVLTNVVMLNFCYDVSVKINSSHYLAMCIFLLLPDLGRLGNLLVFNRAAQPAPRDPAPTRPRIRVARRIIKVAAISTVLFLNIRDGITVLRSNDAKIWCDGVWTVTAFVRDGQEVPALAGDAMRWQRVTFQTAWDQLYVRWRYMNDSPGELFTVALNEKLQTMTLAPDGSATPRQPIVLRYARTDARHLQLEGNLGAQSYTIGLELLEAKSTRLMSRGFHWINR
jgi:uncharacterized membrane protein YphA (DoxX/SURF4 family)